MPSNTNVVLCDRTLHLVKEDSKANKASQKRSSTLIEQLVKIGWTREQDLDKDDRLALRAAFAERFTPEAIKLINKDKATGYDTAPDHNGNHFTYPSGKPKNQAHWKGQITSGLNKLAIAIENRKIKQASSNGASNTKGDIFFRVERDMSKLMKSVRIEHDKEEDANTQKKLSLILSLMRDVIVIK